MNFSQWDYIHNKLVKDAEKSINRHSHLKKAHNDTDFTYTYQQNRHIRLYFLLFLLFIIVTASVLVLTLMYLTSSPTGSYIYDSSKKNITKKDDIFSEESENKSRGPDTQEEIAPVEKAPPVYEKETVSEGLPAADETKNTGEVEDSFDRGFQLYKEGQLKEAVTYLKGALEKGNLNARLPLARALRDLEDADCMPYYIAEVESSDDDIHLLHEAGQALFNFGSYEQALSYGQKILSIDPSSIDGLILSALAAQSLEIWDQSSEYLQKIIALVPDSIEFRIQLAEVYWKQNNLSDTLSEYEKLESIVEDAEDKEFVKTRIEELRELMDDITTEDVNSIPQSSDIRDEVYDEESPNIDTVTLIRRGEHFLVPVIFNDALETSLAIDTGASITTVSSELMTQLGINTYELSEYIKLTTAAGIINAPVAYISKIQVGMFYIENLRIAIVQSFPMINTSGLLGMDFLNNFRFSIDTVDQVLILEVIQNN
jgi:clan AA aspartic protease (TIGR02281 family)